MTLYEIKHRETGAVLFALDCESLKACVEAAAAQRVSLRGADLRGAYLRDAYLRGAYLRDAYLRGAYLSDAYLGGAYLGGADLRGADLHGADLRGADLHGAYLGGADLRGADLRGADLHGADLHGADLHGADLHGADLRGAYLHGADLHGAKGDWATPEESDATLREIAKIVLSKPDRLKMGDWHTSGWDVTHTPEEERSCGTAHCLAGWAQALCPLPIVRRMEPVQAGLMLIPTAAHMFYATNDEALEFLKTKLEEKKA